MAKGVGIKDVEIPKEDCGSVKCPFHGSITVRGSIIKGKVLSSRMTDSVIVGWDFITYIPKYERYKKERSKVAAHNPSCVNAKEGDTVLIGECRPISKTKKFVVLKVIK